MERQLKASAHSIQRPGGKDVRRRQFACLPPRPEAAPAIFGFTLTIPAFAFGSVIPFPKPDMKNIGNPKNVTERSLGRAGKPETRAHNKPKCNTAKVPGHHHAVQA